MNRRDAEGTSLLTLSDLFDQLYAQYGPQGWWPFFRMRGREGFSAAGYHPGTYDPPDTVEDLFQVIAGTILTQNTSWKNAEMALFNLETAGIRCFEDLLSLPEGKLANLIRPSGYYNQKARKLTLLSAFLADGGFALPGRPPTREDLLSVWGVGPETAGSILTYVYGIGSFIADSYAIRLFSRLGHCKGNDTYDTVQQVLSGQIGARPCGYWNEFHALIVEHAKTLCMKKPACMRCFLRWQCVASKSSVVPWENVR